MRWWLGLALAGLGACTPATAPESVATFTNPLLPSGPDPWITREGAYYYYMHTLGNRLAIRRTHDIARLAEAEAVTIWTPPATGPNAQSIWAPELHRIDGKWLVYYTAAAAGHDDDDHRGIFVLENSAADPLTGTWIDRGRVNTAHPGIDGTTFAYGGKRYFVYSPYVGPDSVLAIAEMSNPWTLTGRETIIARPDLPWERQGGRQILEGPEFLAGPKGDLFLSYSASACWSDDYALGLLSAPAGSDPLDAAAWTKAPRPVLAKSPANNVYATGHNGFFTSPDGRETWIVYHANTGRDLKCTPRRSPRMQKIGWTADGRPEFPVPVRDGEALAAPSAIGGRNPVFAGADPHMAVVCDTFWIYPTHSEPGARTQRFYGYSSRDLRAWTRSDPLIDIDAIGWVKDDGAPLHYLWAPALAQANGRFYLYYSVGPQNPTPSRIGVAVGDSPGGPFRDSGAPLLTGGNGFEAIDPMVFVDPASGKSYLYAGGSAGATLRMFELNPDMVSFAREIAVETPPMFTEAPFVHRVGGIYYLSYSHGRWNHADYAVHYATSTSPEGPWTYRGRILSSDETAKGPGHHSIVRHPGSGEWLIAYHRWEGQQGSGPYRGARMTAVQPLIHDSDGNLVVIDMGQPAPVVAPIAASGC